MLIRRANDDDAASLAAISIEVWLGTYLKFGVARRFADFALSEFTPARFTAHLSDPEQQLFLAEAEEGPVGFIRTGYCNPQPQGGASLTEIVNFYVQPRHHGRGIGRGLLGAALDGARGRGAQSVWLTTNSQNAPAIAFYRAQGFAHIGQTAFTIGDESYANHLFERALG